MSRTYVVTVTLVLAPGSVTCPCGGQAMVEIDGSSTGDTFVVIRPKGFRGEVTENFTATVTCIDRSGDSCQTEGCVGTVSFEIIGNNGNDCAQNRVINESVSITC